jgi:hypothetical protein
MFPVQLVVPLTSQGRTVVPMLGKHAPRLPMVSINPQAEWLLSCSVDLCQTCGTAADARALLPSACRPTSEGAASSSSGAEG